MISANGEITVEECSNGVKDCRFVVDGPCAKNNGEFPAPESQGAIMAVSTIFALFMAFGIGSNDAANSWGTSVGSRAISLKTAVILCSIFEFLGAVALGSGVSSTIQKGVSHVSNPDCWACGYCNGQTSVYMAGMMGALIGASIFLLLASLTSLPVSTTHAIVGGVVGMTIAGAGVNCLNWDIDGGLGGIVLSWIISPVLSGVIAATGFGLSRRFIIKSDHPQERALMLMPVLYFLSTFILVLVTTLKAKAIKKKIDLPTKLIISFVAAIIVGLFATFVVKPEVKKKIVSREIYFEDKSLKRMNSLDELDAIWIFRNLLVFNACLESFAHGSNDTANATGAFSAVYQMYTDGEDCQKSDSEIWIMAVAGVFVALGVVTLGYRVIRTMGTKLTLIDFHKGFYIEFASTIATIIATLQEVPVSTTHCQVGAVFAVGLYCKMTDSGDVNAKLLMLIFGGWIITLPLAGGLAMLIVSISRNQLRLS